MITPFDRAITDIALARYHNHRLEAHSDTVSRALYADLLDTCAPLRSDVSAGVVRMWLNVSGPGDRLRNVDLVVGGADEHGRPDMEKIRIAVENKSVITAHRNATSRFDDLRKVLGAIHGSRPEALLVATVMIGLCQQVLNIPDQVRKFYKGREDEFEREVLPRLCSGDARLWKQFPWAISNNRPRDAEKTMRLMQTLPTRPSGHTHVAGYDAVLLVPVEIDNVNPPALPRPNPLGIDVDQEYQRMLEKLCNAYTARWHM